MIFSVSLKNREKKFTPPPSLNPPKTPPQHPLVLLNENNLSGSRPGLERERRRRRSERRWKDEKEEEEKEERGKRSRD